MRCLFFRRPTLLFYLLCFLAGPALAAPQLNFRNYLKDQVANGTVYHTLQDSKGFMWFATETGVIRFDGHDYQQFTMDDGLTDNDVLKIYEDSQKRIWFLTFSGRLCYFYNNNFYNPSNDPVLKLVSASSNANSTYVSFFEDSQHNLWFAGLHNKYLKISRDRQVSHYSFGNVSRGRESFLYEDRDKKLILACREGFFEISNGRPRRRQTAYLPRISRSYCFLENGDVIFLAQQGLVYMQGSRQKILLPANKLPTTHGLSYLYLDRNQDLWLTSLSDGLYCYRNVFKNPGRYEHLLPGKIVTWVKQDSEKNLWFSTIGDGVFMLPSNHLAGETYTRDQGLSANQVYSLTVDPVGQVWLGFKGGLVNAITPQGIRRFESHWTKTRLPNNRVREIQSDAAGNIWLATDLGLAQLQRESASAYRLRHYFRPDSSAYSVKSFVLPRNGRHIYFAQPSGIEKVSMGPQYAPHTQFITGLPRVRTFTNFFDRAGTLWFANVNGLNSYDGKQVKTYGEKIHPLLSSRIMDIKETPNRVLVLATYGNGLIFFKNGRLLKQVTKKDGLPENTCKKLFIKDNTLWVATNKGLGRVLLVGQHYFSRIDSYTVSDGLISNEVNDIFVDDKKVYIATSKGLGVIPNRPLTYRTPPPILQFTGIFVRNQTLDLSRAAELAAEQNRLQFHFTAITFQDPSNVTYQYRLDPQSEWIVTSTNSVELSALEPGFHTFEVRAKKLNSAWSKPIAFSFHIRPPFWRTWWFVSLLTLGVLLIIAGSVRVYIGAKLRQQKRLLETEYRIQQERERIARDLHDNVGSHLAYIINSLEEPPAQANPAVTANNSDLREYTKQTISQLRETIWAIRQETISVRELGAKIQKLIWQASSHRPNFAYEVNLEGDQETQLTPVQALNLFRIAQEAVNNSFKHSQSDCLLVFITVIDQDLLEMRIEDKGKGFDPDSRLPEDHYGLVNMQTRAKELGAQFQISAKPGKGTRIYLRIELH